MKNLLINRALAAKKKKIFTLLLAVTASVGTMFASDTQVDGVWYDFDRRTKTASVTYEGSSYYKDEYSGSVVIPSSVTYNSVTYSVTSIGEWAFSYCDGLTSVTIPNSVTSIGKSAFWACGLTSVVIPNSVTSIGERAFYYCSGLTSIDVASDNSNYCSVDGVLFNKDKTTLIQYPGGKQGAYTIPNSVTSIGNYAFYYCTGLTSVTIPNSVTSIGDSAFDHCTGLTSITIPNSVTSIGNLAFLYCTGLTSVTIPNSVTSIGEGAFNGVKNIVYSGSATGSPWGARLVNGYVDGYLVYSDETKKYLFACFYTATGDIVIPNSVTSIGTEAFYNCSGLTSVTIPNSVTSIGDYAFRGCSGLTSVTIPNSVTSIGNYAFYNCSGLTSVTIGNSVTSIGGHAFEGCTGLTSLYISDVAAWCAISFGTGHANPLYYGHKLYVNEELVTDLVIPNSVTSIGNYAFSHCSGLTSVTIEAETPPTLGGYDAFVGDCPIYVPCNAITAYKSAPTWNYYADRIRGNCASSYTVRFLNWDGSVLQSTQVEAGKIPQYTGATPTKPSDSQYSYTFSGWTPQIVAATADATYTATFKSIGDHNITVRLDPSSCSSWTTVRLWAWTDEGNIFDSWPGQIVSKDSEGWYSYTFDEDITSVNIIWNNGTNQTVDIEGVTSSTCYALNSTSGKAITVSIVDCPLGHADETTTTGVTATPNEDNSVTLTWPAVNGADTYTIEIKKNGVLVCSLVFNANGQLISINFAAPARDGKGRNIPAAEQSANGWTYVVTGLEGNASYTYSVTVKDINGNVLLKQSVDFSTGEEQGIEDVQSDQVQNTKILRDGQILILRGDKTYTVTGQEVR